MAIKMHPMCGYLAIGGVFVISICVPQKVLAASVPLTVITSVVADDLSTSLGGLNLNIPLPPEERLSVNATNSRALFHFDGPSAKISRSVKSSSYLRSRFSPCPRCWKLPSTPDYASGVRPKCGFRSRYGEKCKDRPQFRCPHGMFCLVHTNHENTCMYKRCHQWIPSVKGEYLCSEHENL
jgi:hypothetical protein